MWPAERLFGIDHPLGLAQRRQEGGECFSVRECDVVAEELEAASRVLAVMIDGEWVYQEEEQR